IAVHGIAGGEVIRWVKARVVEGGPLCRAEGAICVTRNRNQCTLAGLRRICTNGVRAEGVYARRGAADPLEMGEVAHPIRVTERGPVRKRARGGVIVHKKGLTDR